MTEATADLTATPRVVGRYALFDEIAAGGMATVHLGRLVGQVGFSRTVAVKRLHPQYAKDSEFVTMFVDEARLASRIQHPNVVSTLDVVKTQSELFLVMEYVQGEALSKLVRNAAKRGERIPPHIVLSVMSGMLHGLHAAHEAKSETREPLNIVHRDISPQNVLVGLDGVARVLDFGVAKAAMRSGATRDGQMKGKLSYMSPEQLNGKDIDRRSDIFAAGIVLWEALAGKRLFAGADAGEILGKVLAADIPSPKSVVPSLPDEVSDAVMRSLERDPDKRFQTAREFAIALEKSAQLATSHTVGEWVREYGGDELNKRLNLVARVEGFPMEELGEPHSGIEPLSSGMNAEPTTRPDAGIDPALHDAARSAESQARRRVVGAGVAVLLLLAAGLWLSLRKDPEPLTTPPEIPPPPTVSSVVVPAPSLVTPPQPTMEPVPSASAPVASASVRVTPRIPPSHKKKCDPPFFFDANNIKRMKPECIK
ncbi:MAG TPA: serine/threonine-protein kinase [Polyangiaceae bacterium]|nr:serine/threonine-protein kinase [Polyangiaceae bacterium]